jgi:hypothetical protein
MTDRRLTKQRRIAANVLPMQAWLEAAAWCFVSGSAGSGGGRPRSGPTAMGGLMSEQPDIDVVASAATSTGRDLGRGRG